MIGDPLLVEPRAYRFPGQRAYNPAHRTVAWMAVIVASGFLSWPFIGWLNNDAAVCVEPPTKAQYPDLDYQGWDNAWVSGGLVLGWSDTEDAECIVPAG